MPSKRFLYKIKYLKYSFIAQRQVNILNIVKKRIFYNGLFVVKVFIISSSRVGVLIRFAKQTPIASGARSSAPCRQKNILI